jgi:hypothetical protein
MQVTPDELSIRQQELELQRAKVFIEFAKYGFAGTLTVAIIGLVLILGLATLSAFTRFKIETWGLVSMAGMILIGAVAFGYLSLWQLPQIVLKLRAYQVSVNPSDRRENGSTQEDPESL